MPDSLIKSTDTNLTTGMAVDLSSENSVTAGIGGRAFGISSGNYTAGSSAEIWVTGKRNGVLAANQSVSTGDRLRCTANGLIKALPGYSGWIIGRAMQEKTTTALPEAIQIRVCPGQVSL